MEEDPFYDVNPYKGEIKLELVSEDNLSIERRELHSINEDDWLLP